MLKPGAEYSRYVRPVLLLVILTIFTKLGAPFRVRMHFDINDLTLIGLFVALTAGSLITLRLFKLKHSHSQTTYGINLGGALLPMALCCWLISQDNLPLWPGILIVLLVAAVVYPLTQTSSRYGIRIYLAGGIFAAALAVQWLPAEQRHSWAFIGGVLGTLIGGDLLHISRLEQTLEGEDHSITLGSDGIMDAIFVSGLLSLLAADTLDYYALL